MQIFANEVNYCHKTRCWISWSENMPFLCIITKTLSTHRVKKYGKHAIKWSMVSLGSPAVFLRNTSWTHVTCPRHLNSQINKLVVAIFWSVEGSSVKLLGAALHLFRRNLMKLKTNLKQSNSNLKSGIPNIVFTCFKFQSICFKMIFILIKLRLK